MHLNPAIDRAAGRPDYSSDDGPTHFASINPVAAGGFARQTMPRPRAWARPTHTATASAARLWLRTNYRRIDGLPNPDDDEYSCVRGSGVSSGWSDYSQLRHGRFWANFASGKFLRVQTVVGRANTASAKHRVLVTISPCLQTRDFFFHFV